VALLLTNIVVVHNQVFRNTGNNSDLGIATAGRSTNDVGTTTWSIAATRFFSKSREAAFSGKKAQSVSLHVDVNRNGPSGHEDDEKKRMLTPEVKARPDTFSACMLIKDDNDLLNEWLAYHYHVLNLRYLLVAVDPSSTTSPTPIFDKWRRLTDLKIVEWSDRNFMPKSFLRNGYYIPPNLMDGDATKSKWHEGHEGAEKVKADNVQIANHRFRQVTFLASCFRHMRKRKKTWTMHIDTDEFVVVNPLLRNTTQANVQMIHIPEIQEKGSILQVVQQFYQDTTMRQQFNYPCVTMPRLLFGSVEFADNFTIPDDMPSYFNSSMLETIRWQYHTDYDDLNRNAQPKVIVDVSAVARRSDLFRKPFSIHRPSRKLCRRIDQLDFRQVQHYPITVNHYTGSWERYHSKNDTRRSERAYHAKAHVGAGQNDHWMSPWLSGFVQQAGSERAKELLHPYVVADTTIANASSVSLSLSLELPGRTASK
jgi:Glycosyl transferase family 2